MPRWSEGLHQAIEAKEVSVQRSRALTHPSPSKIISASTKVVGYDGTAKTSSEEFLMSTGLRVVEVPTLRRLRAPIKMTLFSRQKKASSRRSLGMLRSFKRRGNRSVGTASIEKNEVLSGYFARAE